MSALLGDNVVDRSANMPWYEGTPLLHHLEHVYIASDRNLIDPRLPGPMGDQARHRGASRLPRARRQARRRCLAGRATRSWSCPPERPRGSSRWRHPKAPLEEAFPPCRSPFLSRMTSTSRAATCSAAPTTIPTSVVTSRRRVCWMSDKPATVGGRYASSTPLARTHCVLSALRHRIDVNTLHRDEAAEPRAQRDRPRGSAHRLPLVFDPYRRNRGTGSFILIDDGTNDTVAAGMILESADSPVPPHAPAAANVVWQRGVAHEQTPAPRRPSASGWRDDLAHRPARHPASPPSPAPSSTGLVTMGRVAYRLDGDNLRHGLNGRPLLRARLTEPRTSAAQPTPPASSPTLGCSRRRRSSAPTPPTALRPRLHEERDLLFLEVYMDSPLQLCEERDPEGPLRPGPSRRPTRALTGVDDCYEAPPNPK